MNGQRELTTLRYVLVCNYYLRSSKVEILLRSCKILIKIKILIRSCLMFKILKDLVKS